MRQNLRVLTYIEDKELGYLIAVETKYPLIWDYLGLERCDLW